MSELANRIVPIRTCSRHEQKFMFLLRALVSGPAWRSHAIYEFEGLGINAESSFVFMHLMEAIEKIEPSVHLLSPKSTYISIDELNLLSLLRRAATRTAAGKQVEGDLGFSMPLAIKEVLPICGEILLRSTIRFNSRPLLTAGSDVSSMTMPAPSATKTDARTLRPAKIVSNEPLKSRMRRIQLEGPALQGLSDTPAAKWVKVFPRRMVSSTEASTSLVGRVYTIRKFDASCNLLTIDVAIHGGGAVSEWLEQSRPGDDCDIAGCRGGFEGVPEECKHLILAGDETSLPAIAAILESLPEDMPADAILEVEDASQELTLVHGRSVNVHWIQRTGSVSQEEGALHKTVVRLSALRADCYVWAAGEAGEMREMRRVLLASVRLQPSRIHTVGYWKRGESDHRDASAG